MANKANYENVCEKVIRRQKESGLPGVGGFYAMLVITSLRVCVVCVFVCVCVRVCVIVCVCLICICL